MKPKGQLQKGNRIVLIQAIPPLHQDEAQVVATSLPVHTPRGNICAIHASFRTQCGLATSTFTDDRPPDRRHIPRKSRRTFMIFPHAPCCLIKRIQSVGNERSDDTEPSFVDKLSVEQMFSATCDSRVIHFPRILHSNGRTQPEDAKPNRYRARSAWD